MISPILTLRRRLRFLQLAIFLSLMIVAGGVWKVM